MNMGTIGKTVDQAGETWSPAADTACPGAHESTPQTSVPWAHTGGILRCAERRVTSDGSRTQARIAADVAANTARRIGSIAILTAATTAGMAILPDVLEPEVAAVLRTPLYFLSAVFLVLSAVALAVVQRAEMVRPQILLDLGLGLEIFGAFAIALMENCVPWQDPVIHGSTIVTAWIAICVIVIPNRPWKSIAAAYSAAAMSACAHLLAARILGYQVLPWRGLAVYMMGPLFIAGWTPFISTRIRRVQEELSRTQDLGSYRLERLLGRGGMGEVWLARHRFLRREAAVKIIRSGLLERTAVSGQRTIQRRFELEAQSIASLRSPHTVAIYDFGVAANGSLYYAMEFLHGLDAESLVYQYGPQPAGRVISFLRQACESLDEAHDSGLVHRDVKPGNLFICHLGKRTDFVKLLDFGLVRSLSDPLQTRLTMDGVTSGTPAYMSPEQARGDTVDSRADIYGLGCVAYFLLTGTDVFSKSSPLAIAVSHVAEQPEPPSRRTKLPVPDSLERIVMACLEKTREARPQSAAELSAMLDACTDVAPWTHADADAWWRLHRPAPMRHHTEPPLFSIQTPVAGA